MTDPPYRIVTERLVLRCWEPADAQALKDALDSSLDHLRPWLPWARNEPQSVEEKVQLLRKFRGNFDLGQDFVYGIFSSDEAEVVGGTGLHPRVGAGALEIGYWIRESRAREGLASEATAALTQVAFEICGVDRVEIRVDPANEPSMGVPKKLGFDEEAACGGAWRWRRERRRATSSASVSSAASSRARRWQVRSSRHSTPPAGGYGRRDPRDSARAANIARALFPTSSPC